MDYYGSHSFSCEDPPSSASDWLILMLTQFWWNTEALSSWCFFFFSFGWGKRIRGGADTANRLASSAIAAVSLGRAQRMGQTATHTHTASPRDTPSSAHQQWHQPCVHYRRAHYQPHQTTTQARKTHNKTYSPLTQTLNSAHGTVRQSGMFLQNRRLHFQDRNLRTAVLGTAPQQRHPAPHLSRQISWAKIKLNPGQKIEVGFFGAIPDSGKNHVYEIICKCSVWTILLCFFKFMITK